MVLSAVISIIDGYLQFTANNHTRPDILILLMQCLLCIPVNGELYAPMGRVFTVLLKHHRESLGHIMHLLVQLFQKWAHFLPLQSDQDVIAYTRSLLSISQKPQEKQGEDDALKNTTLRPYSKYLIHLLADCFLIQKKFREDAWNELKEGLFVIMDILNEHEKSHLLHQIVYSEGFKGNKDRLRYDIKSFMREWEERHRFTGKV
jgi:hypothetical protein